MKTNRIWAVILRHYFESKHNLDKILDIVYWPVLDVIVWGFLTVYLSKNQLVGFDIRGFILGAAISWGAFYSFQKDLSTGFLDELWSRNLVNLFSTPLSVWEYLSGLLTVNFSKMMMGFITATILALVLYGFDIYSYALELLPHFFNLLVFAITLGIIITGFIFRYNTKIQSLAWSFAALLQPVSCVFYPLDILPDFLKNIAIFLPTTHAFEGMRQAISGSGFSWVGFWWGLGLNIIYLVVALLFFKVIFDISKKRGLLVKLE